MAMARIPGTKVKESRTKFIRTALSTLHLHTKKATKNWSPFFKLLVVLGVLTFALEILKDGVSLYWYIFLFIIAVATALLEAPYFKELHHPDHGDA